MFVAQALEPSLGSALECVASVERNGMQSVVGMEGRFTHPMTAGLSWSKRDTS